MPSPFPGMNPYLEQSDVWHDFHERFCPLAADLLTAQVRPAYIVKIDEHVFIHELPAAERLFLGRGDVTLAPTGIQGIVASATVAAVPALARLPQPTDTERHSYLQIRDRRSRELVTVIELISPSNKATGPDREQYVAKRRQLLASAVHLVEIDLLRGGPRLPFEELPSCDYYVLVSRAERRPEADIWPLRMRDPLPTIPIPLRAGDPDARLDLQAILHRLHDAAGYEDYIYTGQPQPPLPAEDAAWAQAFVPGSERS